MKKSMIFLAIALVIATLFSMMASAATIDIAWRDEGYDVDSDSYAYTFAAIGDQQVLTYIDAGGTEKGGIKIPAKWKNQNYVDKMYQWIVDNKEEKKIEFVFGLGDITESIRNDTEWGLAKDALMKLNGTVPYLMARGNHDHKDYFRKYMVAGNKEYRTSLEGSFDLNMATAYKTIDICGIKYLMITLDVDPLDREIEWAQKIIESYPEHRVIVTTHAYLNEKGTRSNTVSGEKGTAGNNGVQIWNKLIKKYNNVFMVICGHTGLGEDITYMQGRRSDGSRVHQLMIDPQGIDLNVEPFGMVALLHFSADGQSVSVEYYSTVKDKYVATKLEPLELDASFAIETEAADTSADTTFVTEELPVTEITENNESSVPAADKNGGCGGEVVLTAIPVSITTALTAVSTKKRRNSYKR